MKYEPEVKLEKPEDIQTYLFGGNGVVTLQSPTGKHRTYMFRAPRNTNNFPEGTIFVYVLTSSAIWFYVGMLNYPDKFKLTFNSKYSYSHEIVQGVLYIIKMMNGTIRRPRMALYHCGVCCRCGRRLTSPKSILRGYGAKCGKYVTARQSEEIP